MAVWILPISLACTDNLNSTLFSANVLRQKQKRSMHTCLNVHFSKQRNIATPHDMSVRLVRIAPCSYKYIKKHLVATNMKIKKHLAATASALSCSAFKTLLSWNSPDVSFHLSEYFKIPQNISWYLKIFQKLPSLCSQPLLSPKPCALQSPTKPLVGQGV